MTKPADHTLTFKDFHHNAFGVPGAGTVVKCSCGWSDTWYSQGGNAEASGYGHAARVREEGSKDQVDEIFIRTIELESFAATVPAKSVTYIEPCHDCRCHIAPPCSQCVDCRHVDVDDCEEDCQDCPIDHYE